MVREREAAWQEPMLSLQMIWGPVKDEGDEMHMCVVTAGQVQSLEPYRVGLVEQIVAAIFHALQAALS